MGEKVNRAYWLAESEQSILIGWNSEQSVLIGWFSKQSIFIGWNSEKRKQIDSIKHWKSILSRK